MYLESWWRRSLAESEENDEPYERSQSFNLHDRFSCGRSHRCEGFAPITFIPPSFHIDDNGVLFSPRERNVKTNQKSKINQENKGVVSTGTVPVPATS